MILLNKQPNFQIAKPCYLVVGITDIGHRENISFLQCMRINFLQSMCTYGRGFAFILTRLGVQLYLMNRLPTLTHTSLLLSSGGCLLSKGNTGPKVCGVRCRGRFPRAKKHLPLVCLYNELTDCNTEYQVMK